MDFPVGAVGRRLVGPGHSLFVYGTLRFSEILEVLLGRVPEHAPATAPGWRVAALPGRVYPGLVPDVDGSADGIVLDGLTAAEWAVLDAFEDEEYDLRSIGLAGHTLPACAYVWTAAVAQENWHPQRFAADHLAEFHTRCVAWRRAPTGESWNSRDSGWTSN